MFEGAIGVRGEPPVYVLKAELAYILNFLRPSRAEVYKFELYSACLRFTWRDAAISGTDYSRISNRFAKTRVPVRRRRTWVAIRTLLWAGHTSVLPIEREFGVTTSLRHPTTVKFPETQVA